VGSLFFLLNFSEGPADLLAFFGVQALASAVLALATLTIMPPQWRKPRRPVLALLFCFAFFIPLFGAAGMLMAVLLTLLLPRHWRYKDFGEVEPLEYMPLTVETGSQLRISSLRTALLDPDAPTEVRLRSLVAMQTMPMRTVGPLLRKLLRDPSDDLRLLAYGMLDGAEKNINSLIAAELRNLQKSPERALRLNSLRHLAELHWELVYTGLVQGDVRDHAIAAALRYLRDALKLATADPGLWLLRARLLQARGSMNEADEALNIAVSCGLEEARALPYLAEIAYSRRSFPLVRDYLGLISPGKITPAMAAVVRYWQTPRPDQVRLAA
jgi:hypothetical protein